MIDISAVTKKIDIIQQKHASLAFPVAVIKRYGDDKAGQQAALITYYAFLSLFPLLLVFLTILGIVVSNNPILATKISGEVFRFFPALSSELTKNVHTLKGSGLPLLLEILAALYGARGLAAMLQEAFNNIWHVEKDHRSGFVSYNLRSFAMMAAVGSGIIIGTILSYVLGSILNFGIIGKVLLTVLNLFIIFGLFLAVFRLGTSDTVKTRSLLVGAVVAGTGLLLVQHFGGYIMAHQLPKLTGTYGSFALALGMMFWIYLQAQIILYALEITAVRAQHDWPKKLF